MTRQVAREEYEQLCWMIKKWNRDRLELFEITMPNENLEFEGIMRFYFQSSTREAEHKVATKCIRVSNTANTDSVIEALVQKFRPDLRMLTRHSSYALYEVHSNEEERRLECDELPLMVQLAWLDGNREGRFLLRRESSSSDWIKDPRNPSSGKRPAKRGKKVKRERERISEDLEGRGEIARSLYNVMPESKFTRSISKKNLRNGRVQGPEGAASDTLRVYADTLLPNGPCKSLLISGSDTSAQVVRSSLEKYGITEDPGEFCLVQVVLPATRGGGGGSGGGGGGGGGGGETNPMLNVEHSEYVLGDNDRPLQWKGGVSGRGEVVQFHLRRKDSFTFAQRPHSSSHSRSRSQSPDEVDDLSLPALVEMFLDGHTQQRPRRFLLSAEATEIGSNPSSAGSNRDPRSHLCLNLPSIKPRHCLVKISGDSYTLTQLDKSAMIIVNSTPVHGTHVLKHNSVVRLGEYKLFRFFAPIPNPSAVTGHNGMTSWQNSNSNRDRYEVSSHADISRARSVENIHNSHYLADDAQRSPSSRRLRGKAFSEYNLQVGGMVGEEDEDVVAAVEDERERRERERKWSDTRAYSEQDEKLSSSRKRHPSAPQFNPFPTSTTNGGGGGGGGGPADLEQPEEWLTPLSLTCHQTKQQLLLKKMVTEVDCHHVQFKLAPAYSLYMMARHIHGAEFKTGVGGVSEQRKTIVPGLKSICSHIKKAIKECRSDPGALAFWLANSSELLHFLQHDHQLGALSNDYDIPLTHTINLVYKYFVTYIIKELQVFLPALYDDDSTTDTERGDDTATTTSTTTATTSHGGYNSGPESVLNRVGGSAGTGPGPGTETSDPKVIRHSSISGGMSYYNTVSGPKVSKRGRSTIHDVLQTLSSTITLLKRCHVNPTLSVMVFSNLFRYISTKVFNRLVVGEVKHCGRALGQRLVKRLGKVKSWAEREGMELPAHSHLEMVTEAANLLQASKKYSDNPHTIYSSCPHLNSIQVSTLLELCLATDGESSVNRSVVDGLIHLARGRDDAIRGEGLEVRAEEDLHPELLFHIPGNGYSGETMTGVPSGLQEFLQPMISAGLCKVSVIKESSGRWCPPVRNVNSSQSMDHSTSSQNTDSPHNYNTLPKTNSRSRKASADGELRYNSLPRHGDTDLKVLKVTLTKDTTNNTLGVSIVEAKVSNPLFGEEIAIFIRSMVDGGPAQMDGRLRPGDQIMEVDGQTLLNCTQDQASQILRSTGKKVTLLVAKMAAQYYNVTNVLQTSPRYKNSAPEGSSHAKKAARRMKREQQKERQRQERGYTTEFRLERKQLEQHQSEQLRHSPSTEQSFGTSSSTAAAPGPPDPRFANTQIAKWVMEQNALYNSERGSELEGPRSNSSLSNTADQDVVPSGSPVPSYSTTSSRRTKSSYERHRMASPPPVRDVSGGPTNTRPHEAGHSVSPYNGLGSLEAQTTSDSVSKFSDYSAEPEYSVPPPQSAPPASRLSYKDAFSMGSSVCNSSSQQMSNSLTPYGPSQQMDKLSTDVMYHTPQSGASLSGISSIMPRLLHGRGGKPYLGRIHLKELDGDEIDLEKQRIKLMFYEKKKEDRELREEEEEQHEEGGSSQAQDAPSASDSRKAYPNSPPPQTTTNPSTAHQFDIPTSLEEGHSNGYSAFSDTETQPTDPKLLIQELQALEHAVSELRHRSKELNVAREREYRDLKRAEVEFQEREFREPEDGGVAGGGGGSSSSAGGGSGQRERWQKEQKKRFRHLERYRAAQTDKMQKMDTEERWIAAKLKEYEYRIYELRQQLEAGGSHLSSSVASAAIVDSHLQSYAQSSNQHERQNNNGRSTNYTTSELPPTEDQLFRPTAEHDQAKPEREWPQSEHQKTTVATGRFVSMESINSSSLVSATEIPEFSREIVNTISESTNMTEPTQDDIPMATGGWGSRYVANSDDPYAGEYASKYTYSDDEFFLDDRRVFKPEVPIDAHYPLHVATTEREEEEGYHHGPHSPWLPPNGHGVTAYHDENTTGGVFTDRGTGDGTGEIRPPHWGGQSVHQTKKRHPQTEKYTSGRTDHHYSRSNRPRLHHRHNHPHNATDDLSAISGVSTSSSSFVANGGHFKTTAAASDIVSTTSSFSPSSSKIPSPTVMKISTNGRSRHRRSSPAAPHSPGLLPPSSPSSYSPFREHPPSSVHYSVPNTSSGMSSPAVYDIPRKTNGKTVTTPSSPSSPAVYDSPRPSTSSPPRPSHPLLSPSSLPASSATTSHTSSPGPRDSNPHSPFSKSHNRSNYNLHSGPDQQQQHHQHQQPQIYDVPKPQPTSVVHDMFRPSPPTLLSSDRDLARQTASNMTAHPYQYHGLPTKPMAPRSYSRGRLDGLGYGGGDRGARGSNFRPNQRVQRQQTEL